MSKKNLILGGVLVFLILVVYLYKGPYQNYQKQVDVPDNFLSQLEVSAINKIEVITSEKTVVLNKEEKDEETKWKIDGTKDFYVAQGEGESIIKTLEEASEGKIELISNNKDKKQEFETNESGVELKLYQDETLLSNFIVGKRGSDYTSTYLSQKDDTSTYSIKAGLANVFRKSEWRDANILEFNKDSVNKIRFQQGDQEFIIEKENSDATSTDEKWIAVSSGEELDSEKVGSVLRVMSSLNALKIPEQKFDGTGLEKNLLIVQVYGDGFSESITVGDADETGELFYTKRGSSDNIYLISKGEKEAMDMQLSDLK